ncbi:MAG: zinc ribbon domain-containing protein [Candidatus Bathyarchaeota archaeon]|nr:zinc ribbon domain-containing protein [Candidatus Bathyarchaeota archaeon]MDH5746183.1 zinc ribbon domain-containing protein [Candidatus Bathyarchaeota archaeon]
MTKGQIESKGYSIMSIGIVLICISFLFMFVGSYFSNPGFSDLISWGSAIMGLSILITVAGVVVRAIEKTPSPQLISSTSQHSAVTKEKETIVKEVVMIPCKYCGGLMPQTSIYCPHCGAKRKA